MSKKHNALWKSVSIAFAGIVLAIKQERNVRIHLSAGAFVIVLSAFINLNNLEWAILMVCIGLVITTEIINTSIELISDFICPYIDNRIKQIKDLSAGAVLFSTFVSVVIGLLIFIPKIIETLDL